MSTDKSCDKYAKYQVVNIGPHSEIIHSFRTFMQDLKRNAPLFHFRAEINITLVTKNRGVRVH